MLLIIYKISISFLLDNAKIRIIFRTTKYFINFFKNRNFSSNTPPLCSQRKQKGDSRNELQYPSRNCNYILNITNFF